MVGPLTFHSVELYGFRHCSLATMKSETIDSSQIAESYCQKKKEYGKTKYPYARILWPETVERATPSRQRKAAKKRLG